MIITAGNRMVCYNLTSTNESVMLISICLIEIVFSDLIYTLARGYKWELCVHCAMTMIVVAPSMRNIDKL